MTSSPCPDCGSALVEREHAGLHIDRCEVCHGVWFDPGELKRFAKSRGHRWVSEGAVMGYLEPLSGESTRCPGCGARRLRRGESDGVELFACAACKGFFLPSSALRELASLKSDKPSLGLLGYLDGSELSALFDLLTDIF